MQEVDMSRVRSEAEITLIKRSVEAQQQALYRDDNMEITVAVCKISPTPIGRPDYTVTRYPKAWSVD